MVLEPVVPTVKRMKPYRLKREFVSAWRTEAKRPEGVTFVRTAAPNNSFQAWSILQFCGFTFLLVRNTWQLTHPAPDTEAWSTIWYAFASIVFLLILGNIVRNVIRRRRAEKAGRWAYGLTLWPDRLISFTSETEVIVAPRAALDGVFVDDDATISVTGTNAYGATATTVLGTFSGEPESLRGLLDGWFATTPAPAPT